MGLKKGQPKLYSKTKLDIVIQAQPGQRSNHSLAEYRTLWWRFKWPLGGLCRAAIPVPGRESLLLVAM